MQDARTGVYNFRHELKDIMPVHEFDFDALPEYQISSEDKLLESLAVKYGKKFYGSTSNMTGILSQFHFLISRKRSPHMQQLSKAFKDKKSFTAAAKMAASVFLRYKPESGIYAIDSDKSDSSEIILLHLGRSMEKQLVTNIKDYEMFRVGKSHLLPPEMLADRETYHYTAYNDFLMRSQQDAMDPRLPGEGTFDLKTRAVAAVRYDIDHIHLMGKTDYQLRQIQGEYESFESEYHDMVRASFLKYLLQVRMGRMDGIFVAYHNIARIFGFQYVPRDELDLCIHGPDYQNIAVPEFQASLDILADVLERATAKYPKSVCHVFAWCAKCYLVINLL